MAKFLGLYNVGLARKILALVCIFMYTLVFLVGLIFVPVVVANIVQSDLSDVALGSSVIAGAFVTMIFLRLAAMKLLNAKVGWMEMMDWLRFF